MAQQSYRFQPVFLGGSYWRVELSWRTNYFEQHFAEEWATSIPEQPSTESTWYDIDGLKEQVKNDSEILAVDTISLKFADHPKLILALDPDNESCDIRIWWSANGTTGWLPKFWGIVDLDDVKPDTDIVIGSTWKKTWSFVAYDGIVRLKDIGLALASQVYFDAAPYRVNIPVSGLDPKVYLADVVALQIYAPHGGSTDTILPMQSGNFQIINVMYYLKEPAKVAFQEHTMQTVAAPLAFFGLHPSTEVASPISFVAETDRIVPPTTVEQPHSELYVPYNAFSTEWNQDWTTVADAIAEFAMMIGCGVRTRHTIESGKWVRTLNYVRFDGENGITLASNGVLLKHSGTPFRRVGRTVVVTTRFFQGGHKINDFIYGSGENKNIGLHFRTMGTGNLSSTSTVIDCDTARNIIWGAMIIKHPTIANRYQFVTHVKYAAVVRPTSSTLDAWAADTLENQNGLSQAVAMYLADNTMPARRRVIEEEYSSPSATDAVRATTNPTNWAPCAKIEDDEFTSATFKLLEINLNPRDGTVQIVKEELP